jgi:hypothetical protein
VEILFAIGEDCSAERGSRGGLVDGVKRQARRASRLGEPDTSCLLDAVAVIVLRGVESLSGGELERVVALVDLARSLRSGPSTARACQPPTVIASESTRSEHSKSASRKGEIRAVWMRISEHVEGLRRTSGELIDVSEGVRASVNLPERLADHASGVRQAVLDLESLAARITEGESTCSFEDTSH